MLATITNGVYTAQVDPLGAQLVSLKGPEGFEHLWVGDPQYWREHAPVLFPIVGALRDNRTQIGGEWYSMNRHGFAKASQFTLVEEGKDRLAYCLTADAETEKRYPFQFALTVAYTLTENGYETAFTVENTGDKPMPYAIGGHPGFNIPVDEQAAFEDYVIRFEKEETQRCPGIVGDKLLDYSQITLELEGEREIPLRHELFARDALIFENLNSHTVALVNPATGKGVEMEFSQFPLLGIWSAQNNGPYVCLEPWTGCGTLATEGDVFEQKKGMRTLAPSGKESYAFTIRFL